jgi:hypothetical protein
MVDTAAFTEIVTLKVAKDAGALASFLVGHPYFEDGGLAGWRVLIAEEGHEVVLVLDWKDRGAGRQAITSPAGESLAAGLRERCSGAPSITYYQAMV